MEYQGCDIPNQSIDAVHRGPLAITGADNGTIDHQATATDDRQDDRFAAIHEKPLEATVCVQVMITGNSRRSFTAIALINFYSWNKSNDERWSGIDKVSTNTRGVQINPTCAVSAQASDGMAQGAWWKRSKAGTRTSWWEVAGSHCVTKVAIV